ncbi:TetR family transcriptional regulator C-terminal domain-containing protein [Nonomuraea sp. NPDC049784]|uniref:TetR/AcrR family transcriptional regulator n=1 Tax=Nonomuraea sp. NPDC049784 TaxID=3154361 RepID=UPI0033F34360
MAASSASRAKHTDGNRRAKQEQIIEAAKDVLAREGVAACTARAVADASPLTKSAIHYYFNDINEIVDRAVFAHVDTMLDDLRRVAGETDDPYGRLLRVVDVYLATFADKPHAAFLWFEYWINAGRRDSLDVADRMLGQVHALLRDLVAELAPEDPDRATHALVSWLLGTIVQQHLRPKPAEALHDEIALILAAPGAPPHRTATDPTASATRPRNPSR